jgi:carbonic anhydrase/acetyltransferase-like protein (isoleucine patch superfamily)
MSKDMAGISRSAFVPTGANVASDVFVGELAILVDGLTIEEDVRIGAGVIFATDGKKRTIVKAGSRVAAGAVIGAGIELGRKCEVRAGSVVLDSVPANAIVQGNPAQIIGYNTESELVSFKGDSHAASTGQFPTDSSVTPLGVGGAALHRMKKVVDMRGSITVGEVGREVPFKPERYFIIFDVPNQELRGAHAHRVCHQFLICVRGSSRILVDDGVNRREVILDRPEIGVYMPPMIWGTQYRYTVDAVLLVFASHHYDANDYIRSYDQFLELIENSK